MHVFFSPAREGVYSMRSSSSWFLSGTADDRWDNNDLHALTSIPGSDFEAVDESMLQMNPNSAQVAGLPSFPPSPTASASPSHSPATGTGRSTSPHDTLTPEIVRIDQSGQNGSNPNVYPSPQNTVSSGIGNRLPVILGGVALLLAITGGLIGIKRRKRFKPSS